MSDAPATGRKPLSRGIPPEWLDSVLLTVCQLDPEATVGERAAALVDALAGALPGCGAGIRIPVGARSPIMVLRSPREGRGEITADRLFPELAHERVTPIGLEDGATLHLAADDPQLLAEPAVEVLADRVVLALRAVIRHGRALDTLRDQIIQSDRLATVGQIAAGVVHELNNPLTSILAYSDYLRRKGERAGTDPADLDRLARINEAATRILRFSRDLTAYSRPSGDQPGLLSIHDVLDRALIFCEHVLDQTNVFVEKSFGDVPPVVGVAEQLTQVFVNLFTNAAQAMRGQGGCLEIATELDGSGASVRVRISDEGHGIEPEHLPRVFDPFFTTRTDGTGLGLSIVRSIVEAHGGHVRAEHRATSGMIFSVELPAVLPARP